MMKASFVVSLLAASLYLTGCAEQKPRAASTPATPAATASTTTQGTADRSATEASAAEKRSTPKPTESAASTTDTAAAASAGESITGCLSKGESEGTFVLTDETSSAKTTVTGPEDLAKHAGHKVKLTGTRSGDQFTATAIQHIAPSCTTK